MISFALTALLYTALYLIIGFFGGVFMIWVMNYLYGESFSLREVANDDPTLMLVYVLAWPVVTVSILAGMAYEQIDDRSPLEEIPEPILKFLDFLDSLKPGYVLSKNENGEYSFRITYQLANLEGEPCADFGGTGCRIQSARCEAEAIQRLRSDFPTNLVYIRDIRQV